MPLTETEYLLNDSQNGATRRFSPDEPDGELFSQADAEW